MHPSDRPRPYATASAVVNIAHRVPPGPIHGHTLEVFASVGWPGTDSDPDHPHKWVGWHFHTVPPDRLPGYEAQEALEVTLAPWDRSLILGHEDPWFASLDKAKGPRIDGRRQTARDLGLKGLAGSADLHTMAQEWGAHLASLLVEPLTLESLSVVRLPLEPDEETPRHTWTREDTP